MLRAKTSYFRLCKYRQQEYYLACLSQLFSETFVGEGGSNIFGADQTESYRNELIFFLGAMFYPKKLRKMFSDTLLQQLINQIHESLYSFTRPKLKFLTSFSAFNLILEHFMNNFSEKSIQNNSTMKKA